MMILGDKPLISKVVLSQFISFSVTNVCASMTFVKYTVLNNCVNLSIYLSLCSLPSDAPLISLSKKHHLLPLTLHIPFHLSPLPPSSAPANRSSSAIVCSFVVIAINQTCVLPPCNQISKVVKSMYVCYFSC
jgi:hypothetical protein